MAHDYTFMEQHQAANGRWWFTKDPKEKARDIFAVARDIYQNQRDRELDCWTHLRMYNGQTRDSYSGSFGGRSSSRGATMDGPRGMTLNVVQSIIDTAVAKVAVNDIKSTVLTDGESWGMQEKAKKLDQLTEGVFYANKMRRLGPAVLRDSLIFDAGIVKVFEPRGAPGTIKITRVIPMNFLVDPLDGADGEPRQIHYRDYVSRDVLISEFPEYEVQIKEAKHEDLGGSYQNIADKICIIESWHLPSGPGKGDGRHTIAIETMILLDEEYKKQTFPFVFLRAHERPIGFYGQGFAEMLAAPQIELNRLLRHQARSLYLLANPRWYVRRGSQVSLQHIDNEIGSIIQGNDGDPPKLMRNEPVSEQVIAQIENIYRKVYEIIGVSQNGAQAEVPKNLESGVAIQTHANMQTERFTVIGKAYEQFYIDLAYLVIDLMREIHEREGSFKTKTPGSKFLNTVDFGDADLENDEFTLKIYPTNMLPTTPEGRLDKVTKMFEAGLVSQEFALSLLDYPDLKSVNELNNAPLDNLLWNVEQILGKGIYQAPEPYQNLQLGLQIFTESLLKARRMKDIPEDHLEMVRLWIAQASGMVKQAMAPPPPMGAGTPLPATAAPTPNPTDELMPSKQAA